MNIKGNTFIRVVISYLLLGILSVLIFVVLKQWNWFGSFYKQTIFFTLRNLAQSVSGAVQFSLSEVLVLGLIVSISGILVYVIIRFKHLNWRRWAGGTTWLMIAMYWLYMFFWGLCYAYPSGLESYRSDRIPPEDLNALAKVLVRECNRIRSSFSDDPVPVDTLISQCLSSIEMVKTPSDINPDHRPLVKSVMGSRWMSHLGISGIYFPFTGESNINADQPRHSIPFTACHEIAHQWGYAREDEANCIGFMIAYQSKHPQIRYSALFNALRYTMHQLYFADNEAFYKTRELYGPGLRRDVETTRTYWAGFAGEVSDFSENINHVFLLSNDQDHGSESYNDFIYFLHFLYQDRIRSSKSLI